MALVRRTIKFNDFDPKAECIIADSAQEMAGGAYRATVKNPLKRTWDCERDYWIGRRFSSLKDVVDKTSQPWEEGLKAVWDMIQQVRDSKLPTLTSRKRRTNFKEHEGDDVDLDKMRSGQAYWRAAERKKVNGPGTMTLIIDTYASCAVNFDIMFWRAAAGLALAYLMEEAGYRLNIWSAAAVANGYEDRTSYMAATKIKGHRDPLNIGLAASISSPWFFRTITIHGLNMAADNRTPTEHAGNEYMYGLKRFVRVISNDEVNFIVQNVWDKEDACDFVRRSAEAIEAGELSALPWQYSWLKSDPIFHLESTLLTLLKQGESRL